MTRQQIQSDIADYEVLIKDASVPSDERLFARDEIHSLKEKLKEMDANEKSEAHRQAVKKTKIRKSITGKKIKKRVKNKVKVKGKKKLKQVSVSSAVKKGRRKARTIKLPSTVKKFNRGRDAGDLERDRQRQAMAPGKRTSAEGNIYYEARSNRADRSKRLKLWKGGKMYEDGGGIDLFEDYKNIPSNVQEILDKYSQGFEDGDYAQLASAQKQLESIGYTFEYGLDGVAYNLRKIGEKGNGEDNSFANGGSCGCSKHMNEGGEYECGGVMYNDGGEVYANGGFIRTNFNSHKDHNPNADILEGYIDNDSFITYGVYVNGDKQGQEFMEYYKGSNYVAGSNKPSFSRFYTKENIPSKFLLPWNDLREKYIHEYSNYNKGGEMYCLGGAMYHKGGDIYYEEGGSYKKGGKFKRCDSGTELQSVLFDRDKFTEAQALAWAKEHGMKHNKVDRKPDTIRVRQKNPFSFKKGSFRTIDIGTKSDGLKATIACPK